MANNADFLDQIARGTRTKARGGWISANNVHFDGRHAYSYGTHYPLMVRLDIADDQTVWIVNDTGYGNATSKHIGHANMAAWRANAHHIADASLRMHIPGRASLSPASLAKYAETACNNLADQITELRGEFGAHPRRTSIPAKIAEKQKRIVMISKIKALAEQAHAYQPDQNGR